MGVSVVIRAFCPAQTSVSVERNVARSSLLHIASTVSGNFKKRSLVLINN
ncbi:hypothetical protein SAMN05216323_11036 [Williamwhitmania taraxaci]|uniref:Uncharacterized protein n=1 Tax=Williamwhitmania taraxaci TaxID=1640674 RepID=A0A1G6SUY6_9BACT|nr:hypothetical protein SAMN05216323_11036 [Williamwhitmania taraxaci]